MMRMVSAILILSRAAPVLALACTMLAAIAGETSAHAALVSSDPTAGAILDQAPREIRLRFSEPLEASYTGADLLDATATAVAGVTTEIAPGSDHELLIALPADLPHGGYTVAWRTLSAADGHTLQGYFGFQVGAGSGAVSEPVAFNASAANETVRALTRGLALIGLAMVLAIAPVTLLVLVPAIASVPALAARLTTPLRRYSVTAALFALLANLAALAAQAATIAPDASLPVAMTQTLAETRYGQLWFLRLFLLALCIAAVGLAFWGLQNQRRPALLVASLIALALPLPFSLLSHAAAQTEGRATAVAADAIHLLAAAVWGGGVLLLAATLIPALRGIVEEERWPVLRAALVRFSFVGLATWGILLLTGLYAAWLQVGTLDALRETSYGRTLILKGVLLLLVLPLAAFHLVLGQRGAGPRLRGRVPLTLVVEALLVVAILLVVGRLIGQEPAREVLASRVPTETTVPLAFVTDDGDREGQLTISPGAAGINTFIIAVDGPPLLEGSEGVLRFALPSQAIGAQELRLPAAGSNRFVATGPELALPGDWQVAAIVRRIGAFSWSTEATIAVPATPPRVLAPNPAPLFTPAGLAGLIVAALGVAVLAAAAVSLIPRSVPRIGLAVAGAAVFIAGIAILGASRIAQPAPEMVSVVAATPSTILGSPAAGTAVATLAHDHAVPSPAATPVSLPGPGTPVAGDGLTVTIAAEPAQAGPTAVSVDLTGQNSVPQSDARVVVFSEMPAMAMGRTGTPAQETSPGHYVAESVPLAMSGEWRITVRVSPRGQPTQTFAFALPVP
jgi:copper transport protein